MEMNEINITRREQEVLHLLANDYTSKELAQQLYISLETVNTHRKNLREKLGVKTSSGMICKGYELGLLQLTI